MRTTTSSPHRAGVYRRRRLGVAVIGSCVLSFSVLGACNVLADPGGEPASAAGILPAVEQRHVIARRGDTIWEIAKRVYADEADQADKADKTGDDPMPFAEYVDAVVDRNGGTELRPGDVVVLP